MGSNPTLAAVVVWQQATVSGPWQRARMMVQQRPDLSPRLTGAELRRWYWLHAELVGLARVLGVSPGGGKQELTDRLAAAVDRRVLPTPSAPRRPLGRQLAEPLTDDTVLPTGQRSSCALRSYFVRRVGAGFRFDAAMRDFVAHGAGRTLGEAVAHWHATRSAEPPAIGPQFELNRFTRDWHRDHPGGSRAELVTAWTRYRALPVDARPGSEMAR